MDSFILVLVSSDSVYAPVGKVVFLLSITLAILIRLPHQFQYQSMEFEMKFGSITEAILLLAATMGMIMFPIWYICTDWLVLADYNLSPLSLLIGVILEMCGLFIFYLAHRDLGLNYSALLELRDEHELITHGIYRHIRHPMYAAIWLMVLGQAFLLANVIAGFGGILGFGFLYVTRIDFEEQMLIDRFGTAYRDYMERTGRLIPKDWFI